MPKPILITSTKTRGLYLLHNRRSPYVMLCEQTTGWRREDRVKVSREELAKICEAVGMKVKEVSDGSNR